MPRYNALLIGAAEYGDGFVSLPAVRNDIEIVKKALEKCQFSIDVVDDAVVSNAAFLDKTIRAFCEKAEPGDVRLIYFSGHGLRVDGKDFIIPSGASRKDALESSSQRVPTDLSKTVRRTRSNCVVFVIDACRDEDDSPDTKGAGWGSSEQLDSPEGRFIRFFGCEQGQVCNVLPKRNGGKEVSVFSKALADELLADDGAASLKTLLKNVEQRCVAIADKENRKDLTQTPRLSYSETGSDTLHLLEQTLFVRAAADVALDDRSNGWKSFDPSCFHCVAIISEFSIDCREVWGVEQLVDKALSGTSGSKIWDSFRKFWQGRKLLNGKTRELDEAFSGTRVRNAKRRVTDAFKDNDAIVETVTRIVEADLAVFDVTHFEPGMMILLGIRAACRRGVTICSYGDNWHEGEPLVDTPFNLRDLNFNSHTKPERFAGENPVVMRFVERATEGFEQMRRQPSYMDLPIFSAVRNLGSEYSSSSTIDIDEEVLLLCSYGEDYFSVWEFVQGKLESEFSNQGKSPRIYRLVDIATPQLVSQHLYERIRRVAGCIVDWSEFSPSAFFELGARFAVSAWGAVQVIEQEYLPGNAREPRIGKVGKGKHGLKQVSLMKDLFQPNVYEYKSGSSKVFAGAVSALLERRKKGGVDADYNNIHRVVSAAVAAVQESSLPIEQSLASEAESLHNTKQARWGAPQLLFHREKAIKVDAERAALERRLTAWLYLEYRVKAGQLEPDDPRRIEHERLGKDVLEALYELGSDDDFDMAALIEERLGK